MIRPMLSHIIFSLPLLANSYASAQTPAPHANRVVISGTVPDEVTKAALVAKLQDVYGPGEVIDQLSVGDVTTHARWSADISKLVSKRLKAISKGQLRIEGTTVSLRGEVASDALRRAIAGEFAGALNTNYVIRNGLRVTTTRQSKLDQALANRVVEFEAGSALLTDSGKLILDDIVGMLKTMDISKIEVIGHTDNVGDPAKNLALSLARADSVKTYLIAQGMASEMIGTSGMGADQPIMPNTTEEGRRRNRRIEFRIGR